MPGFILHLGATVMCIHGGHAQALTPHSRVRVAGHPVVTQPQSHTVTGCPFMTGSNPNPCVTAQWTSAATRVRVEGMPVLVQQSQAVCTPNGTGVQIPTVQTRVRAV